MKKLNYISAGAEVIIDLVQIKVLCAPSAKYLKNRTWLLEQVPEELKGDVRPGNYRPDKMLDVSKITSEVEEAMDEAYFFGCVKEGEAWIQDNSSMVVGYYIYRIDTISGWCWREVFFF